MNLSEKLKAYLSKNDIEREKIVAPPENLYDTSDHIETLLNAKTVATPFGEHLVVEKNYPLSHIHGSTELRSVLDIPGHLTRIIAKDDAYKDFDFSNALFIDTETTGLAGGTGTLAFLTGIGFFDKNNFKVIQYFIRDYDEEAAALYSLNALLKNFKNIISFNGRCYDVPLLTTRYLLNRMENPLEDILHLDLLLSARRFYRERLESVSLSSLETNLLFIKRRGDIPGWEIPSVYFRFLNDRNPLPLKPIFYHNCMDILSMVAITDKIAKSLDDPINSESCQNQDYYCIGRVFEDMGMIEESICCYNEAVKVPEIKEKSYLQLSLLYKRLGNWHKAEELWIKMVEENLNTKFALLELAKYYEHKVKDYNKALKAAQRALEIERKKDVFTGYAHKEEIAELKKRIERIELKKEKSKTAIAL